MTKPASHHYRVLLHYNTAIAVLLGTPLLFVSGELNRIAYRWFLGEFSFWWSMVLAGGWGLLINVATFVQSKMTTHFTCAISGIAKVSWAAPELNLLRWPYNPSWPRSCLVRMFRHW